MQPSEILELEAHRIAVWQEIRACSACPLRKTANVPVPGRGLAHARLVLVGEAPGAEEDARGIPFCGPAGELQMEALMAARIPWQDVYVTNIVRCRPPGNRVPTPEEIRTCSRHLMAELGLSPSAVIVAMGRTAADALRLGTGSMGARRGRWYRIGQQVATITWHPSYVLRQGGTASREWDDLVTDLAEAYGQACKEVHP